MRRPASLPHAVMTEIRAVFTRRKFKAGDRLPPERELAKQLSVGRSSLREAIQGLQTMGLVERRQGVGTFFVAEPGSWSIAPLKVRHRSPFTLFEELIEVRLLLEVRLAALAAERATEQDLEKNQRRCEEPRTSDLWRVHQTGIRFPPSGRSRRQPRGFARNAEGRVHQLFGHLEFIRQRRAGSGRNISRPTARRTHTDCAGHRRPRP